MKKAKKAQQFAAARARRHGVAVEYGEKGEKQEEDMIVEAPDVAENAEGGMVVEDDPGIGIGDSPHQASVF